MSFKEAYLLSFFHSQRTTTAPQTEVMSSPSQLKAGPMPSKPKRVPPTKPPMRPKRRSMMQPLPFPFVILLAIKPARIPVIIPIIILLKILSVVLENHHYGQSCLQTVALGISANVEYGLIHIAENLMQFGIQICAFVCSAVKQVVIPRSGLRIVY